MKLSLNQAIDKYSAFPEKMKKKFIRQGIREEYVKKLMEIYKNSANDANYVSGFDIWLSDKYWEKNKNRNKRNLFIIESWKKLYNKIGITNTNYCNPDISFMLFMENKNLLNDLKNEKICLITPWSNVKKKLKKKGFDVTRIDIPPLLDMKNVDNPPTVWHSDMYEGKKLEISIMCKHRKIFLVGAGNLGRGYLGHIKKCGGIAIDIGKVMDAWDRGFISPRLRRYIKIKDLSFYLTKEGKKYKI